MRSKSLFTILALFGLALSLLAGTIQVRGGNLQAAIGTEFTYQGRLTDGGTPANGTYDFEFILFDALSDGNQVGSPVMKDNVTVTDGLFTVQLNFGDVFDGTALYLQIGVRSGASIGAYTTLTPRQALTAAPYARYAAKAPWSGLTNVPAGFADGVDDGTYQNVVIVAKSGGDFTSIQAALDSISDASDSNHYLVWVAPGVYTERVTMKPYVDIEGAGELATKITFTGSTSGSTGTVVGANNAELRFLTVENTGGARYATAIYNNNASPRLTHVTASASGGDENRGVDNHSSAPTMTDMVISVKGVNSINVGVANSVSSPATIRGSTISASGGSDNRGVDNHSSSATIQGSTISASDGNLNWGVINFAFSGSYTVTVSNCQVMGSTNTINNDAEYTTLIGASQLSGGAVFLGGGTVTCAGVYDEAYAFYPGPICP